MAEKSDEPDELYKAKARVMDRTIRHIASLANSLGYGNCLACRALFIGEGFSRDGDTWRADKNRGCEGINPYQRLAIAYSDWGFPIKEVKYEKPVIVLLDPEIIDSGTLYNDDDADVEKSIQRSEASVRSVTHTPTSSWKQGHDLGVTVSYESPFGLSVSGSYAFNYEKSTSTTDERGREQTNTIVVNTKKTVKPHTAVKWHLLLSRARTTVVYTATVKIKFSVELQGFLKLGGSFSGNFHNEYRLSHHLPTFHYKFGNKSVPFYEALRQEYVANNGPWLWNEMSFVFKDTDSIIRNLSITEEIELTGKFEDVIGKQIEVHWTSIPFNHTPPFKLSP